LIINYKRKAYFTLETIYLYLYNFLWAENMSEPQSWENTCCRCGDEVKETIHPGKRACHVTCGSCLYPDNPKCASCEIVGHCRLALDYLRGLRSNAVQRKFYFQEQLTGEETLYHTLSFVDAQQHLIEAIGEKKYLRILKDANSRKFVLPISVKNLPKKSSISPEKANEIQEREKERTQILIGMENRGPSTISELSAATGIEKSKLLKHLTAMRQFGKVEIVSERDNQPIFDLLR
jgi:hypothetical protein